MLASGEENTEILISDDEEGNGFHELFYGMSKSDDMIAECEELAGCEPYGLEPHKILLG